MMIEGIREVLPTLHMAIAPALVLAAPYIYAGVKALGSYLSARGAKKSAEQDRYADLKKRQEEREDEMRKQLALYLAQRESDERTDERSRAQSGLEATQMDPYAHAKARNKANVRRSFAEGLDPKGNFSGKFDTSAITPDKLDLNADYFYHNVAETSPNVPLGGMAPQAELFRQQRNTERQSKQNYTREEIMRFLQMIGSPTQTPITGWK